MIPREILKNICKIEIRTNRLVSETFASQNHNVFKGQGVSFRILLLASLLLGCSFAAHANLGENFNQIAARYGNAARKLPASAVGDNSVPVYVYKFNGRNIYVEYIDGKSSAETVSAPDDKPRLPEDTALAIGKAISGNPSFIETAREDRGVFWFGTNCTVNLQHGPKHDLVMVASMKWYDRQKTVSSEEGSIDSALASASRYLTQPIPSAPDLKILRAIFGAKNNSSDVTQKTAELLNQPEGFTPNDSLPAQDGVSASQNLLWVRYAYKGTNYMLAVSGSTRMTSQSLIKNVLK